MFVRESDFLAPQIHRYAVPLERSRVIFADTTIIENSIRIENDVVVNRGLDVRRVERLARAPVERAPIERVPRVAPVDRVTRDELRVDPDQMDRGRVRAAAPDGDTPKERAPREPKSAAARAARRRARVTGPHTWK